MRRFFVDVFVQQQTTMPPFSFRPGHHRRLDPRPSTGPFLHGYYDYCYLPLYVFCDDQPLLALLRPSNIDACTGALKHV
jgi:hypothetical protein